MRLGTPEPNADGKNKYVLLTSIPEVVEQAAEAVKLGVEVRPEIITEIEVAGAEAVAPVGAASLINEPHRRAAARAEGGAGRRRNRGGHPGAPRACFQ